MTISAPVVVNRRFATLILLRRISPTLLSALLGIIVGLILWAAVFRAQLAFALPGPVEVGQAVVTAATSGEFYQALGVTLRRTGIAWGVSILIAVPLGMLTARSRVADSFMRPWILTGLTIPSPVVILFTVLLFGLSETTAVLSLIVIVVPFIANIIHENMAATPHDLLEMADAYGFDTGFRIRHIFLPHLGPALLAAARVGLQLSWKTIVIMEALVRSDGIGAHLELFFRLLQPERLLAWTVLFAVVMVVVELCIFRPVSRRVFRWRARAVVA